MLMSIISLLKELIVEAKKAKNYELAEKLIDFKIAVSELEDENKRLRMELEHTDDIERHKENYITLKSDPEKIRYCATCWGDKHKLIQLTNDNNISDCPICFREIVAASKGKR